MSENILVVEYEPRYTDRVKQALAGQPFNPTFAKDGEEAMRALDGDQPRLIVLSSVVPKISTTELIRAIRGRKPLQETPILLTVSGYNGKSPKQDAQRVGASDILPKPYSETEFLGKVQQMLGVAGIERHDEADLERDLRRPSRRREAGRAQDDGHRHRRTSSADVDKMLADTLGGMMPKRREAAPTVRQHADAGSRRAAAAEAAHRTAARPSSTRCSQRHAVGTREERAQDDTGTGSDAAPERLADADAAPPPAAAPPEQRFNTEKMKAYVPPHRARSRAGVAAGVSAGRARAPRRSRKRSRPTA